MIEFSVDFKLPDSVKLKSFKSFEILKRRAKKVLEPYANRQVKEVKKSINTQQSQGRRYGSHFASLAGYPPNSITGNLSRKIGIDELESNEGFRFFSEAHYSGYLEGGTRFMEARPFFYGVIEAWTNSANFRKMERDLGFALVNELETLFITKNKKGV